jgi:hypothetical protein
VVFEASFDDVTAGDTEVPKSKDFLTEIYKSLHIEYGKFYKMDRLSKAGFLAAEYLMREFDREEPKEDMAIVLFNRSSSLDADMRFRQTIDSPDNYYPSPSDFVYTLPNIVTGEIAIRNKIFGETAFYLLPEYQEDVIADIVNDFLATDGVNYVLAGWVEVSNGVDCRMRLLKTECGF